MSLMKTKLSQRLRYFFRFINRVKIFKTGGKMNIIKKFSKIIDSQTIIITFLAILSTYLCNRFGFYADLPSGLIGIAIIFPIVFSINSAYKRREEALKYFASMRAHAIAIFYAHRDWVSDHPEHAVRVKKILSGLLESIKDYFLSTPEREREKFNLVYKEFSEISLSHERLRKADVPANEISRVNQYLRAIIIDFEKMRNIFLYRTPVSLRAYSQIFLNIFPILYAPYFASLCNKSYEIVGYGVAVVYSIVLVSLDNIQEDLESPYDEIGADDVNLDVIDEFRQIMELGRGTIRTPEVGIKIEEIPQQARHYNEENFENLALKQAIPKKVSPRPDTNS
jgi:predicted membrane chloride channel (bestrophin family)